MGPDAVTGNARFFEFGDKFDGIGGVFDGDVSVGGEGEFDNLGEHVREAPELMRGILVFEKWSVAFC